MIRYRTLAVLLLLLTLPLSGCDLVGTDDNDSAVVTDGAYVANQGNFSDGNGSVTLYDPNSEASTEAIGNLSSIVQSIALRNDRLYLTANSGGRLDVFDADDQSPLRQLTGLSGPRYLTLPDDDTAFLTSQQSFGSSDPDSVHVLDANGSSVEVTESLAVPGTVEGVTHTGSRVYAALGGFGDTTLVAALNAETNELTETIDVGCASRFVLADSQSEVYAVCTDKKQVVRLDGSSGDQLGTLSLPDTAETASGVGQTAFVAPEARELYIVVDADRVVRIDTRAEEVVATLGPLDGDPIGAIGYDAVRQELYVGRVPSFTEQGTVTIHERDGTQTGSFQAGVAPTFIDFRRSEE
jgi:hypothetical protein